MLFRTSPSRSFASPTPSGARRRPFATEAPTSTRLVDFVAQGKQSNATQIQLFRQMLAETATSKRDKGDYLPSSVSSKLEQVFRSLDKSGKFDFLLVMATELGTHKPDIVSAAKSLINAQDREENVFYYAEQVLRRSLIAPHENLFTQLVAQRNGMKFLIDMRADVLAQLKDHKDNAKLKALDDHLRNQLQHWFSIGFLELKQINFDSPASLLEKIKSYSDSVHPVGSWDDLKARLGSGHRCFGFFHPSIPFEPLVFIEVALVPEMATKIQPILASTAPSEESAKWAIFYAITSTQDGLAGVDLGNMLIKRVVHELSQELPGLKHFCTLSPIPSFKRWLDSKIEFYLHPTAKFEVSSLLLTGEIKALGELGSDRTKDPIQTLQEILATNSWLSNSTLVPVVQPIVTRLCAQYLINEKKRKLSLDPVCNFHIRNGARLESINFLADASKKRYSQSYGMMVNYYYDLTELEANNEAYLLAGTVKANRSLLDLLKQ